LRILITSPEFAISESDSNCSPQVQRYVAEMVARGHDVHVVALEYPSTKKPYEVFGARVYPCNGGNHWYTRIRTIIRAVRYGDEIFTYGKPDIIHSISYGLPWLVGSRYGLSMGVSHVCTLMDVEIVKKEKSMRRRSIEDLQQNMVTLSDPHRELLELISGSMESPVIPWGISDEDIPQDLSGERPIDILGVGALIPIKDWFGWLRVVAIFLDQKPDARAVLIGEGRLLRRLKKFAKKINLQGKVEFLGHLPRPELLQKMRQSKVLLHSSIFEAQGHVLLEAAAQGCHIISRDVGIASKVAECEKSLDALALRVRWAVERQTTRKADVPFSMSDTAAAYEALYVQKCSKHKVSKPDPPG
jgi:1,2-diacylglycerol 3-alpha-glucosyltransferase